MITNKTKSGILISLFTLGITGIVFFAWRKHAKYESLNQQYQQGLKIVYDRHLLFCPDATIAYCDSVLALPVITASENMSVRFTKAFTLLKLGKEPDAIKIFQQLLLQLQPGNNGQLATNSRMFLALAYLRLGERNNCLLNHSNGSCIFPLQGNGIYTDPGMSEKAISLYQEILKLDSNDLESRWLLNIAYMTIGQYPSKIPAPWLIPGLDADDSSYHVRAFKDLAGSLKLNGAKNRSGGTVIDDLDNDGYLDIVTSSWGLEDGMHYFKNNADGTFTDVSEKSGLSKIKGGLNLIQADYNNDGYVDIFVLRGAWMGEFGKQPNTLLKNNGDGTFSDVTISSGLLSFHPTQTATWADFNNDGWLDLFIGNETTSGEYPHPSELYISNQDGSFTDVAGQAGCQFTGFMKGVIAGDYNRDGYPDIFISMLDNGKILLKNNAAH